MIYFRRHTGMGGCKNRWAKEWCRLPSRHGVCVQLQQIEWWWWLKGGRKCQKRDGLSFAWLTSYFIFHISNHRPSHLTHSLAVTEYLPRRRICIFISPSPKHLRADSHHADRPNASSLHLLVMRRKQAAGDEFMQHDDFACNV